MRSACRASYNDTPAAPQPGFRLIPQLYGAAPAALAAASRIAFWNGLLDPWSSGGILEDLSDSLVALVDPLGGHHADLNR